MKLALCIAGAVLLTAGLGVAADQNKPAHAARPAAKPAAPPSPRPGNSGAPKGGGGTSKAGGGGGMVNPLNPVQRMAQMTPEQRERILEQLPPQRQEQVRKQLEKFDNLPPAAKERLSRAYQALMALPPEKQRMIDQAIRGLNGLPADRKSGPVPKELRSLLAMSPDERAARIASDDFKKNYSPDEQRILSDLSNNLPPDYPLPGRK